MNEKRKVLIFGGAIIAVVAALSFYSLQRSEEKILPGVQEFSDFSEFRSQKEKLPQLSEGVSLIFVGDIMLSRDVDKKMEIYGYDFPWENVREFIESGDIAFGNLETAITSGRDIDTHEMVFRADLENARTLSGAGFDILSLANNHTMDFGAKGMKDTIQYLGEENILISGAGLEPEAYEPVYIEKKGIKFAYLSYASTLFMSESRGAVQDAVGVALMDRKIMKRAVEEAAQNADIVIVSMHAGDEYEHESNEEQREFAHAAIEAGADLVIGHHPHVVQPVEEYMGKYIFYSLGNFIFDQMWSDETRQGLAIKVFFNQESLNRIELMPIIISDFCQPDIIENDGPLKDLGSDILEGEYYFWDGDYKKSDKYFIKSDALPVNYNIYKERTDDLDEDGILENYILDNGVLSIWENSEIVWKSENGWWVDDFEIADSNNDGKLEINMSVWRAGDFGPDMPRWIKENDMSIKNHFFLFNYTKEGMKALWQSSNLDAPNCSFKIYDIDKDEKNELVVVEGEYGEGGACVGKHAAVWEWKEWGFYNDWRGERGVAAIE